MNDVEFEEMLKRALIKAAELDYMSVIPPEDELDITPSPGFQKDMARLLKNPRAYVRKRGSGVYQRVLRTAASVLLVISVLFGLSMLNPSVRAKFSELLKTWFPDHTEYSYEGDTNSVIPKAVKLGYVPEGFELVHEEYDSLSAELVYQSEEGGTLDVGFLGDAGRLHLDNEYHEIYTISVGDSIIDVYESNDARHYNSIVYDDRNNELILVINSSLPIDELMNILENIEY